jgi:hypothetical protein
MQKSAIFMILALLVALLPIKANSEQIDVLIKGRDDGVKTSKQQDYKEAVMNAKLEAIERAGVEISSITRVVNFQTKFDMVESKAKAVLLPGFQVMDLGYQTDGTYLVVLSGKIQVGEIGPKNTPEELLRRAELEKLKAEKSNYPEARISHLRKTLSLYKEVVSNFSASKETLEILKSGKIELLEKRLERLEGRILLRDTPKLLKRRDVHDMIAKYHISVSKFLNDYRYIPSKYWDKYRESGLRFDNIFGDNGDGTITDFFTGLMWKKSSSTELQNWDYDRGDGPKNRKWGDEYMNELNTKKFAGYSDWRVPTLEELASLLESKPKNGKFRIDSLFDVRTLSSEYVGGKVWSADLFEYDNRGRSRFTREWRLAIDFDEGGIIYESSGASSNAIIAVRSCTQ